MKKRLTCLVSLLMLLIIICPLMFVLPACNKETTDNAEDEAQNNQNANSAIHGTPIKIGILSDIQLRAEANLLDLDGEEYQDYLSNTSNFKMLELTEAIYRTSVDELIAADVDVAFLIGDLTDDAAKNGMKIIAEGCKKLTNAGIPTFVTNGLCDINHRELGVSQTFTYHTVGCPKYLDYTPSITTGDDFVSIMGDYGFKQAVSRDSNSLSYAADIPGTNYRVIVIDNASYTILDNATCLEHAESKKMPAGQMTWIRDALLATKSMDKVPLVITNIPLNPKPVSYFTDFVADTHLTMQEGAELEALLAENGVDYVFSGHYHINKELNVETSGGNLTEVYTSSSSNYPCTIRYFDIAEDGSYSSKTALIERLNPDYLTNTNISKEDKLAVETGFVAYSKVRLTQALTDSLQSNMYRKEDDDGTKLDMLIYFFRGLDIYPNENPEVNTILEKLNDDALQFMVDYNDMPIYGKDIESVESICAEYGLVMPNSRYTGHCVRDFIFNLVFRIYDSTFMVEEADIDSTIFTLIFQAGTLKLAELDLFEIISPIYPMIVDCDMVKVAEYFMETGIIDLKMDNFLLATISLFFPYIKQEYHIDLSGIKDITGLLETIDIIMPIISLGIEDIALFCNEEGKLERENCYSMKNATIYGKNFIEYIMFSVIVRSVLTL